MCISLFVAFGATTKRDYSKRSVSDPRGTLTGVYAMHAINQGWRKGRTIDSSTTFDHH